MTTSLSGFSTSSSSEQDRDRPAYTPPADYALLAIGPIGEAFSGFMGGNAVPVANQIDFPELILVAQGTLKTEANERIEKLRKMAEEPNKDNKTGVNSEYLGSRFIDKKIKNANDFLNAFRALQPKEKNEFLVDLCTNEETLLLAIIFRSDFSEIVPNLPNYKILKFLQYFVQNNYPDIACQLLHYAHSNQMPLYGNFLPNTQKDFDTDFTTSQILVEFALRENIIHDEFRRFFCHLIEYKPDLFKSMFDKVTKTNYGHTRNNSCVLTALACNRIGKFSEESLSYLIDRSIALLSPNDVSFFLLCTTASMMPLDGTQYVFIKQLARLYAQNKISPGEVQECFDRIWPAREKSNMISWLKNEIAEADRNAQYHRFDALYRLYKCIAPTDSDPNIAQRVFFLHNDPVYQQQRKAHSDNTWFNDIWVDKDFSTVASPQAAE